MDVTGYDPSNHQCTQIGELLGRLGDRWTLPVVVSLRIGPMRFNQIRRVVAGISQQMLTRTLKTLERDGMVTRTVYPTVPPQVEYALTALGHSLSDESMRLGRWLHDHLVEIDANRATFDGRSVPGPAGFAEARPGQAKA